MALDRKTLSDQRRRQLVNQRLVAALIVVTLAVYVRILAGDFLDWDDWKYVVGNMDLRPDHWPAILKYWYQPHIRLFIPVTFTAYAAVEMVSVSLTGALEPWVFHACNLLLHVASGLLLWKLLTRSFGDATIAAAAAGLFLLHPVQVESVCWISDLNTLLSGFLAILTLWFYACSLETPSRRTRGYFIASCFTTVLAMLAKPSSCGLPFMAMALHWAVNDKEVRRAGIRFLILGAVELPMVWIAHRMQVDAGMFSPIPWLRRPLVVLDALGSYVINLFAPIHLAIDYGRAPAKVSFGAPAMIGICSLSLLFMMALLASRTRPRWLIAGGGIFLAALLPILGIVPFDYQFYSTVADRYLYLAMVGPAIVAAAVLRSTLPGLNASRVFLCLSGIVLSCLAILSFVQVGTWSSDTRLFAQALYVNPHSIAANQALGFITAKEADEDAADSQDREQMLKAALEFDRRALDQDDHNPRVHFNRANLLLKTGHPDEASADYAAATGRVDEESSLQNNWGVACLQLKHPNEALSHFRSAIAAAPDFADAYANSGAAYSDLGQLEMAREQFSRALTINPQQPQAIASLLKISRSRPTSATSSP